MGEHDRATQPVRGRRPFRSIQRPFRWYLFGLVLVAVTAAVWGLLSPVGQPDHAADRPLVVERSLVSSGEHPEAGPAANAAPVAAGLWPPTSVAPSAVVVTAAGASLAVYSAPGDPTPWQTLANPNPLGAKLVLLVVGEAPGWFETYLPERPNEATGWVRASDVTVSSDPYRLEVGLSERQLILYRSGQPVLTAAAAIGEPDSPTPTGSFYVTEVLQVTDQGNPYGPYALGLSAFSGTYTSFDGGPGQVAIHGTNEPWLIGGYASHGCVRLSNQDITSIATTIPAGTPVDIEA